MLQVGYPLLTPLGSHPPSPSLPLGALDTVLACCSVDAVSTLQFSPPHPPFLHSPTSSSSAIRWFRVSRFSLVWLSLYKMKKTPLQQKKISSRLWTPKTFQNNQNPTMRLRVSVSVSVSVSVQKRRKPTTKSENNIVAFGHQTKFKTDKTPHCGYGFLSSLCLVFSSVPGSSTRLVRSPTFLTRRSLPNTPLTPHSFITTLIYHHTPLAIDLAVDTTVYPHTRLLPQSLRSTSSSLILLAAFPPHPSNPKTISFSGHGPNIAGAPGSLGQVSCWVVNPLTFCKDLSHPSLPTSRSRTQQYQRQSSALDYPAVGGRWIFVNPLTAGVWNEFRR